MVSGMTNLPTSEPAATTQGPTDQSPESKTTAAGLAIAALVVGIVAFLSGWVPIWGLIAGAAAVLLGILALVRHQSKGLAIPGLILGGLAILTSLVTTIFMVVGIGVASTGSNTVVTDPNAGTSSESEAGPQEGGVAEVGTRENPASIGSTIQGKDWTVVVNSFTTDGNATVADANTFNEAPKAGSHYSIVNYTITYTGSDSSYAAEVSVALVTVTGEVLNSYDTFVVLEDSMGLGELYNGGTATGSQAFLVPDGVEVSIRVNPGFFTDDTFVAAS